MMATCKNQDVTSRIGRSMKHVATIVYALASGITSAAIAQQPPLPPPAPPVPVLSGSGCHALPEIHGSFVVSRIDMLPPLPDNNHAPVAEVYFKFQADGPVKSNFDNRYFGIRRYGDGVPKLGTSFSGYFAMVSGPCPVRPMLTIDGQLINFDRVEAANSEQR